MMRDGFRKGRSTFFCGECNKLTRRTQITSGTDMCRTCFKNNSEENRVSDL